MRIHRCPRCQERFELFETRSRFLQLVYGVLQRRGIRCQRCGKLFSVWFNARALKND